MWHTSTRSLQVGSGKVVINMELKVGSIQRSQPASGLFPPAINLLDGALASKKTVQNLRCASAIVIVIGFHRLQNRSEGILQVSLFFHHRPLADESFKGREVLFFVQGLQ